MAIHKFRGPDGKIHKVEAPADADPRQLEMFIKQRVAGLSETPTGTPSVRDVPPLPTEGEGAGFMANLRYNLPTEPNTRLQQMAQQLYPGDPNARQRVGTQFGRPVFVTPQGDVQYADVGAGSTMGSIAANLPETIGGIAGSFSPTAPFGGSVLGAVGGRGLKQAAVGMFMDEPQTVGGNIGGLVKEAAISGIAAAPFKGAQMLANRSVIQQASKYNPQATQRVIEDVQRRTGIRLDVAQAADIPQLRAFKRWAANYPGDAAEMIQTMDNVQADQISEALERRLLSALTGQSDNAVLANNAKSSAEAAIAAAKIKRREITNPFFAKTETALLPGDVANELGKMETARNQLKKVLNTDYYKDEFSQNALTSAQRPRSIKAWDLVRRNLRDMESKAISNNTPNKARLFGQQADRVERILSQANPDYAVALSKWGEVTSEIVDPLTRGVVGQLAKIEGTGVAKKMAQIIEGDVTTSPDTMKALRSVISRQSGADTWRGLMRVYLSKQFQRAAKETQAGDVTNMAGKFRQMVVGTPAQKNAMKEAFGSDIQPVFDDLMEALQLVARETRTRGGSMTEFNRQMSEQQAAGTTTGLIRAVSRPLDTIGRWADNKTMEQNAELLAAALTDPRKMARLKELRKLPAGVEKTMAILGVIGPGQALAGVEDVFNAPPTSLPNMQLPQYQGY